MPTFVGRSAELRRLTEHLEAVVAGGRGRLLAVRGRRQVGKSALLTRFVESSAVPSIYLTAIKNASPSVHLADLSLATRTSSFPPHGSDLFDEAPTSWSDALQRIGALARDPLIVVIDEFPWAAAGDPTLDGRLQATWDRTLEGLPILLVLVGSDMAVMERTVAHDAPLYGRARPVVVEPLDLADVHAILGVDAMAAVDVHLVTGGYPRLVQAAVAAGGAHELIAVSLTDAYSELIVTGALSLDAELPSHLPARAVLEAIGHDSHGPAVMGLIVDNLAASGGTARAQVSRAIEVLEAKRLVTVDKPIGAPAGTRLRRYRITDSYLHFWLRFLAGGLGDVQRGRGDLVSAAVDRGWQSWRGRAVEPIVLDRLWRRAPDVVGMATADEIGGWWDRAGQRDVDVVAAAKGRAVAIGTIKWRENTPVNRREMRVLGEVAADLPGVTESIRIAVCPSGVDPGVDADVVWTAEDVVRAL